jgi:PHP family Zn ribbon phosphoesterase
MKQYRADLHIHTVLSPCGDLRMSPATIVGEALKKDLDIIGITDHNATRHCSLVSRLAEKEGIVTITGAEVTTKEEVHCLVFFENTDTLELFGRFLDENLPDIRNNADLFGDQVEVDEYENIVYTEEKLLTNAINVSLEELEIYVHSHGGLFIPAHIDRMKNSIYSQLGFLPENIRADALEISARSDISGFRTKHPEVGPFTLVTNSDAHYPEDIGKKTTLFSMEKPTFDEIRMALGHIGERRVINI